MAIQAITNHLVCPTENDVNGGTVGAGIILTELNLADLLRFPNGAIGHVVSGFTPPSTGSANRTQSIAGGVACIDGRVIRGSATTSVTFTASATEYWWLQLLYTSSKAVSLQYASSSSETTYLSNAIPLWKVICNATDVTTVTDRRPGGRRLYGTVNASKAISDHGSGFWSVAGGATGVSTLTFASGLFIRTPIVVVSPTETNAEAFAAPSSATSCTITTTDLAAANADKAYSFTATI